MKSKRMKNNKRIYKIAVTAIVILVVSVSAFGLMGFLFADFAHIRFFTDISSFDKLTEYEIEEIEEDKKLKGLVPLSSYTNKILYGGKLYSVYAYVFSDVDSSRAYFKSVTGKKSDRNCDYSFVTNYYFYSQYIVFNDNCLYLVQGGNYGDFVTAFNFITESFPLDEKSLYE